MLRTSSRRDRARRRAPACENRSGTRSDRVRRHVIGLGRSLEFPGVQIAKRTRSSPGDSQSFPRPMLLEQPQVPYGPEQYHQAPSRLVASLAAFWLAQSAEREPTRSNQPAVGACTKRRTRPWIAKARTGNRESTCDRRRPLVHSKITRSGLCVHGTTRGGSTARSEAVVVRGGHEHQRARASPCRESEEGGIERAR